MNLAIIPNLITVMRIILVVPIAWLLLEGDFRLALVLFAVAGVSDALDGFLARHFNWQSWWGSVLDPLADKLLQVTSYVILTWLGHVPVWLVVAIVLRDVVIISGAFAYHHKVTSFEANPSIVSKLNTFMQIVVVLGVILHVGVYSLPETLLTAMFYLVFATTVYSGVDYVVRWTRLAMQHKQD